MVELKLGDNRFNVAYIIRVRVGDPERIIGVPGCVDGAGLTMLAASVFQLVGAGLWPVLRVCQT